MIPHSWTSNPDTQLLLLNWVLQVTVVALLALAATRLFRRRSAPLRHALQRSALLLILLSPVTTVLLAQINIGIALPPSATSKRDAGPVALPVPEPEIASADPPTEPADDSAEPIDEPVTTGGHPHLEDPMSLPITPPIGGTDPLPPERPEPIVALDPDPQPEARPEPAEEADPLPEAAAVVESAPAKPWAWVPSAVRIALIVWAFGALMALAALVRGAWRLRRFRRSLMKPGDAHLASATTRAAKKVTLRKAPIVCLSPRITVPLTLGIVKPVIVFPVGLAERLTDDELEGILLHEAAHIARGDHLVGLMQRVTGILFWWHPLVRGLDRALNVTREEVCDNVVLAAQGTGERFAECLVRMAEAALLPSLSFGGLELVSPGRAFENRVKRLLRNEKNPMTRLTQAAALTTALFVAMTVLALSACNLFVPEPVAPEPVPVVEQPPAAPEPEVARLSNGLECSIKASRTTFNVTEGTVIELFLRNPSDGPITVPRLYDLVNKQPGASHPGAFHPGIEPKLIAHWRDKSIPIRVARDAAKPAGKPLTVLPGRTVRAASFRLRDLFTVPSQTQLTFQIAFDSAKGAFADGASNLLELETVHNLLPGSRSRIDSAAFAADLVGVATATTDSQGFFWDELGVLRSMGQLFSFKEVLAGKAPKAPLVLPYTQHAWAGERPIKKKDKMILFCTYQGLNGLGIIKAVEATDANLARARQAVKRAAASWGPSKNGLRVGLMAYEAMSGSPGVLNLPIIMRLQNNGNKPVEFLHGGGVPNVHPHVRWVIEGPQGKTELPSQKKIDALLASDFMPNQPQLVRRTLEPGLKADPFGSGRLSFNLPFPAKQPGTYRLHFVYDTRRPTPFGWKLDAPKVALSSNTVVVKVGDEADAMKAAMEKGDLDRIAELVKATPALVHQTIRDGRTALHIAAGRGHLELAILLLDKGADIHAKTGPFTRHMPGRQTPLHWAAGAGQEKMVALLLKRGAQPNVVDKSGDTPLHAVRSVEIGKLLIANGARVNAQNRARQAPLHKMAQSKQNEKLIALLLSKGADPNLRSAGPGSTPFELNCYYGNEETVKAFLASGARVNPVARKVSTPLHRARTKAVAKLLLDRKAKVDAKDRNGATPLQRAAARGDADVVRLLLESGAKVNTKDRDARTPLHKAKNNRTASLLLGSGADPQAVDTQGWTPIHFSAARHENQNTSRTTKTTLELLLAKGGKINAKDRAGYTPLHYALIIHREKIVAELRKHGAKAAPLSEAMAAAYKALGRHNWKAIGEIVAKSPAVANVPDYTGRTLLHWAAGYGRADLVKTMLKSGADPNRASWYGSTPLHQAVIHSALSRPREWKTVDLLLKDGAKINPKLDRGWSPLHDAVQGGNIELVEFLIKKGADVNAQAQYRAQFSGTPLHLAALTGRADLVTLLLKHKADANAKDAAGDTPTALAARKDHLKAADLLRRRPLTAEEDILDVAVDRVPFHQTGGPDRRVPKFGNFDVDRAVLRLAKKYKRPYTLPKVIQWYRAETDFELRAALLYVLAASVDERAVPILGPALYDKGLYVRVAATYSIMDYFMETPVVGGTWLHMVAARAWWQKHKAEYPQPGPAVGAIIPKKDKEVLALLREKTPDGKPLHTKRAIIQMSELGHERVLQGLAFALSIPAVRQEALYRIRLAYSTRRLAPFVIDTLRKMQQNRLPAEGEVRHSALLTLLKLKDRRAILLLLGDCLDDPYQKHSTFPGPSHQPDRHIYWSSFRSTAEALRELTGGKIGLLKPRRGFYKPAEKKALIDQWRTW